MGKESLEHSREIYEKCIETLGEEHVDQNVYVSFAKFETRVKEIERARAIYKYALERLPRKEAENLHNVYAQFEKQYGGQEVVEDVIVQKRRIKYESDYERARAIYKKCLEVIPHRTFTFAKLWLQYAKFLIRRYELDPCRKHLGMALGLCPKERLFKGYIDLEVQLKEFDRVRKLYEKYLEWNPANGPAWIRYAELELSLGDIDRCRAIFELAVNQPLLDMPEVLWKGYIDFETGELEWERARLLYERLLERTEHVKVWVAFANFELSATDNGGDTASRLSKCRAVYRRAYDALRRKGLKEERVVLLESWQEVEKAVGDEEGRKKVQSMMPRVVKKRRRIEAEEGESETGGWEEYFDYIFPDEEGDNSNLKLLQLAHAWKQKIGTGLAALADEDSDEDSDSDDVDEEDGENDEPDVSSRTMTDSLEGGKRKRDSSDP
ncbi:Crooked neck-like protein 1 [Phlyctochytrium bullatum]|nr:Crooked neck-like protein 1 [Phlyctochytrium bullatum]